MKKYLVAAIVVSAAAGFGAMSLSSSPASAQAGYCYYHPHAPACLAGVVAPYVYHHQHYHDYDDYDDYHHHHQP